MADKALTPGKQKREARKARFKMIMPGGSVDNAFTQLFATYKALDERLNLPDNTVKEGDLELLKRAKVDSAEMMSAMAELRRYTDLIAS